jgi:hypothetical protein
MIQQPPGPPDPRHRSTPPPTPPQSGTPVPPPGSHPLPPGSRPDVDTNIYNEAWRSQDRGDNGRGPREHGSVAHYIAWWQHGATKIRTAQCNTWNASSSDVS